MYFKENLIYLLQKNNLKQIDFAKKIGISRQVLNDYIKKNKNPKYETLIKISDELKVTIDDLLKKDLSQNEK